MHIQQKKNGNEDHGAMGVRRTFAELCELAPLGAGLDFWWRSQQRGSCGEHRSAYFGQGMSFEELRPYQQGDESRLIDWRALARTGKLYTKLFAEDRTFPVWFVVDAHCGLHFGTRRIFKWVQLLEAIALMAYSACDQGLPMGLLFGTGKDWQVFPPEIGEDRLYTILAALLAKEEDFAANQAQRWDSLAAIIAENVETVSYLCMFSDAYDLDSQKLQDLRSVIEPRHLQWFWLVDPIEQYCPQPNAYRVHGIEQESGVFATNNNHIRQAHRNWWQQRCQMWFSMAPETVALLNTAEPTLAQLLQPEWVESRARSDL
jgi:uncharacterized protein (DUF58 family)